MKRPKVFKRASLSGWTKDAPTLEKLKLGRALPLRPALQAALNQLTIETGSAIDQDRRD
jgi:hypothetical protein